MSDLVYKLSGSYPADDIYFSLVKLSTTSWWRMTFFMYGYNCVYPRYGYIALARVKAIRSEKFYIGCIEENKHKMITEHIVMSTFWNPILNQLSKNQGILRVKPGESTNPFINDSKQKQYPSQSNIIGFKIDSRFLFDHGDHEFDLGCLEAAINPFNADKVYQNRVKLAREAKEIVDVFTSKSLPAEHCRGWAIQIGGLSGKVTTVNLVNDKLYVCVPQFHFKFPSNVSELPELLHTLEVLSTVMLMMEQAAEEMRKAMNSVDKLRLRFTNLMLDPSTLASAVSSKTRESNRVPTYFSPPQKDYKKALLPNHPLYTEARLFADTVVDIKTIENASAVATSQKRRDASNVYDDASWAEVEGGWYNRYGDVTVDENPYKQ